MEDGISRLLHYCYEGMLQERQACIVDVEKAVSPLGCIFQIDGLGI